MRYVVTFSIMTGHFDAPNVTTEDIVDSVKKYIAEADDEQITGMVECAVVSAAPPLMIDAQ